MPRENRRLRHPGRLLSVESSLKTSSDAGSIPAAGAWKLRRLPLGQAKAGVHHRLRELMDGLHPASRARQMVAVRETARPRLSSDTAWMARIAGRLLTFMGLAVVGLRFGGFVLSCLSFLFASLRKSGKPGVA
eukprot:3932037-Amphidinium_carterae.1